MRSSGDLNAIERARLLAVRLVLGAPFVGRAIGAGANALMRDRHRSDDGLILRAALPNLAFPFARRR